MAKPAKNSNEIIREIIPLARLGAPVALAHLANILMQIVDTIFVGKLGPEALGGVSIANAQFVTLMIIGVGFLLGLDFLVSHDFGAGKISECNRWLVQGLYVATFIAIPCSLAMFLGAGYFNKFGATYVVAAQAKIYMQVLCWSLWPFLLFVAFRQYLQAMGVAVPVLWILLAANILNAIFNWAFIFGNLGFRAMGIAGSGWATVLARLFMLAALVFYILRRDQRLKLGLAKTPVIFLRDYGAKLFRLGLPSATQCLLEVGVFATATFLISSLGAVPVSAHQIALNVASFTFMIPLGMGSASAVRVGQAMGAGHPKRAVHIGWIAISFGAVVMLVFGIGILIFKQPLSQIFTHDLSVIRIAMTLLCVAAFFQLFDAVQVISTGVLRGVGNTRLSMIANFIGHWLIGLPVGAFLCFNLKLNALGLWMGLSAGLVSVALILVLGWIMVTRRIAP